MQIPGCSETQILLNFSLACYPYNAGFLFCHLLSWLIISIPYVAFKDAERMVEV